MSDRRLEDYFRLHAVHGVSLHCPLDLAAMVHTLRVGDVPAMLIEAAQVGTLIARLSQPQQCAVIARWQAWAAAEDYRIRASIAESEIWKTSGELQRLKNRRAVPRETGRIGGRLARLKEARESTIDLAVQARVRMLACEERPEYEPGMRRLGELLNELGGIEAAEDACRRAIGIELLAELMGRLRGVE